MANVIDTKRMRERQEDARRVGAGDSVPVTRMVAAHLIPPLALEPCTDPKHVRSVMRRDGELVEAEDEGYARYLRGKKLKEEACRAASLLEGDLTAEERTRLEGVAARADAEGSRDITYGLQAHRESPRLREQLMSSEYSSYQAWAVEAEADLMRAAEELAPVLERYMEAWKQATERWDHFRDGTVAAIVERDESFRHSRDMRSVRQDADLTPLPLPENAVELVQTTKPRPLAYGD